MTDSEMALKGAAIFAGLIAMVFIGYFAVFVVVPLFIAGVIIDQIMRASYPAKVKAARAKGGLHVAPAVHDFEARLHDGQILVAWLLDLPGEAYMEIYRLTGQVSGEFGDIRARGVCVHTSGLELTNSRDDIFTDHDAPEGVLYYVPVLYGKSVEKRILDYGFFSFYGSVQYTTRRKSVVVLGSASRVVNEPAPAPMALPDDRDDATKMADDILQSIKTRKEQDQQLDGAIERIKSSPDLNEAEKLEAIELLETRSAVQ